MTIFVVIQEDRHSEDEITLFSDKTKALAFAKEKADEAKEHYDAEPDEELNDFMIGAGWIFYSDIEDVGAVRVETKELQE